MNAKTKAKKQKDYLLDNQLSLLPPEEYEPIQKKALSVLTHIADNASHFNDLVEQLGLEDILCQLKSSQVT